MTPKFFTRFFLTLVFVMTATVAAPSFAQDGDRRELLGSYRDWDALTIIRPDGERICYMISVPKETAPNNVLRGEIYTMITMRPRIRVVDEVNVIVGYPFRDNSEATLTIGNRRFNMFTEADGAWMRTPTEDSEVVAAMRAGNSMVVRGTSSRGTNTTDRYSLMGFTAAYNAIKDACK